MKLKDLEVAFFSRGRLLPIAIITLVLLFASYELGRDKFISDMLASRSIAFDDKETAVGYVVQSSSTGVVLFFTESDNQCHNGVDWAYLPFNNIALVKLSQLPPNIHYCR